MKALFFIFISLFFITVGCSRRELTQAPNILFCLSDDQSFPHASAYGCSWVNTPAFDKIAKEGLLFTNAYTSNAKCAPSRAVILTGRNSWQLEEAANHVGYFPNKFKTVFESLRDGGYQVGRTGKGWAPGIVRKMNGKKREIIGKNYSEIKTSPPASGMNKVDYAANFRAFLDDCSTNAPFAFWFGCNEPHRRYEYASGINKGEKSFTEIDMVPPYWMDNDTIRTDLLDYAFEIEYYDSHLQEMIVELEKRGLLENTLIVVTSDNGMPFPRCKAQEYPSSCHLPLAIMWGNGIKKTGRTITDYVSFVDFAATFLEVATIDEKTSGMHSITGKSLMTIFNSKKEGRVQAERNYVLVGKERHDTGRPHDVGYPIRGIISDEYVYLKNFKPDRWPTGRPETGYLDCDGSPTKTQILDTYNTANHRYWEYSFGRKPEEEFFNRTDDRFCVENLAKDNSVIEEKELLKQKMLHLLREQQDPRVLGNDSVFDKYPIMKSQRNFYNRYMTGEKTQWGWVNASDFRPFQNEDAIY